MRKWKKYTMIGLLACIMIHGTGPAFADPLYKTNTKILVQGKPLKLDKLFIYMDAKNQTLVPIRFLSEALGAMVHWNKKESIATIYLHPMQMELKLGEKEATIRQIDSNLQVTREETVPLDASVQNINGRIYVPLYFIVDKLLGSNPSGTLFNWNGYTNTLSINSDRLRDPMMQQLIEMKTKLEDTVPGLRGNVFINSETHDVLINLSGNGSIDNISMGIRVIPKDAANTTDREQLKFDRTDRLFIAKPQDKNSQKALKDILKMYFPVSYEKVNQSAIQMKKFHLEPDGKTITGEPAKGQLSLWIHYPEQPTAAFDKAIVNIQRADYTTTLFDAVTSGSLDIVKLLLEEGGANPNILDSKGESILMKAAAKGNLELVKLLHEEYKLDVNQQSNTGETPLMMAVSSDNIELIQYLLTAGANPNANTVSNETALMRAVLKGNFEAVKLLLFH